jgi:large subunit ribosomal protein L10
MEDPRPEKVAVVDEVKGRLSHASAALLTEYRGLDVRSISDLRRAVRAAGGDYKIFKNTLVRFAVRDLGLDVEALLIGPTAIAFVGTKPDGTPGDAVDVAKALRDFARTNPSLVVKGGLLGEKALSADEARALADVESRDVLLSKLAGALAAPMQQLAGLLQALPRDMAYGLAALIDERGGVPADAEAAPEAEAAGETEAPTETDTTETDTTETDTTETDTAEAPQAEAATTDAADSGADETEQ